MLKQEKIYEITCINTNGDAYYAFCVNGKDAKEARRNARKITHNTIIKATEVNNTTIANKKGEK